MTKNTLPAQYWLELWSSQRAWSKEWMLQFIRDIQFNSYHEGFKKGEEYGKIPF